MSKELLQERGRLEHRMKELVDRAEAENRDLNAEENQEWDQIVTKNNELRARIERHQRLAETRGELDRVQDHGDRDDRQASRVGEMRDDTAGEVTEETRALAFAAWAMHESRMDVPPRHREACRRLNVRFDVKEPEFPIAATHEVRALQDVYGRVHPSMILATRSLNLAGESAIVPEGFIAAFEKKLLAVGGLLQVVDTLRTQTGNPLPWPTVDDTANEGEILAEEADHTTSGTSTDPTIGSVTLNAHKFSSKPVRVSRELIEDEAIGLAVLLGDLQGERIGKHLNAKCTTGTGTNEPEGFVTAAAVGKTATATNAIDADELIDLYHSVDPAYRMSDRLRFMMHDSIVAHLRKLKDADNQYLWQSGLQAGVPDRLLGVAVTINQAMASSLAANAKPVAFGDFSKMKLRIVRGLRMRHLVELYAETDQEAFIGFLRADAKLLNDDAIKILQMAAA